ncbi:mannitol dehydrogenase family protein [Arthrobacter sp. I2-34]|uniref:Mannitol-1-phosphate 5-dehydrogenase n=1 Tax=Arthrobacter hankyongi TaxID=2904801 RepID=A0ABS9LAJ3_9MICC|nr:mannitol dehydrogenase family protein [Arthrobacter hankyongi]MCG2623708.1 mannitol dehydrogenase family protein [Arthrobacter hankyongi]
MTTDAPFSEVLSLSASALPKLRLPTPDYDRSAVGVGIVHIGVGGFHRAHQAMYLDQLMQQGRALDWGICGMGVLPGDRRMKEALAAQDYLYTLVVKHPDGSTNARVVGSIVDFVHAPDDPQTAVERLADPSVRIVSLTITEGGYNFNQATGEFDATTADVVHDLEAAAAAARGETAAGPRTVFGLVAEALHRRRERDLPPFTVMSCDNIQGNGDVARRQFTAYAALRDKGLADWMDSNVPFPNSMVDRITPVTAEEDRRRLAEDYGVEDRWPVVCEPFAQWVLEDRFVGGAPGRPPWEEAGVQLVDEVEPYELMKLRLLNASHQALCYPGYLAGYRYAHEVCSDPTFVQYLLKYMDREATPTLKPVPGIDLEGYRHQLIERFANPAVRDTLARLCAESSDRIPKWLVPVIRENLAAERPVDVSAAIVASWARYAEGADEQGAPIDVVDQRRDQVMAAAARQLSGDPLAFVRDRDLFADLADHPEFTEPYLRALESFHERGARATIESLIG